MKSLILVGPCFISTFYNCHAENSAQDLGGISANKMREINILKAEQNRERREANSLTDNSFGGLGQSLNQSSRLQIPQIMPIGQNQELVQSPSEQSSSQNIGQANESSEESELRKKLSSLVAEYQTLKNTVKENGKNYSQLSEEKVNETDQQMKRLLNIGNTLKEVPDQYFDSDRPDLEKDLAEVLQAIDRKANARFQGMSGDKDENFLNELKSYEQEQSVIDDTKGQVEKENKDSNSRVISESSELIQDPTGLELIRSKCSGSVGSKNGTALVKHLTSGECGQAINADPELKAQYNIKKIVELISAWGFKTASFSSATNVKLGINKLPELGIVFDLNDTRADFKAIPYQPAVEVQQTQLLSTQDDTETGPLKELMPRKDKSVLGHSVRD